VTEDLAARWPLVEQAVLEVHMHFVEQYVEGRNWCPFARPSRQQGTTTVRICPVGHVGPARLDAWGPLHDWLTELADHATAEVLQVVFPLVNPAPRAWDTFAKSVVEQLHAARGGRSVLAVAAFHPTLEVRFQTEAGIVPLLRRSPMPMIQFVRLDALDRVREGRSSADRYVAPGSAAMLELMQQPARESLGQSIMRRNHLQVTSEGFSQVERDLVALADLAARRLLELGVTPEPWDPGRT
jgi:hypothetical protein